MPNAERPKPFACRARSAIPPPGVITVTASGVFTRTNVRSQAATPDDSWRRLAIGSTVIGATAMTKCKPTTH
jgi:hypothetical protein